jgi:hypothetical protein
MRLVRISTRIGLAVCLSALLATGVAFGKDGDRGGRGGGGGGGGGGGHQSFSGGHGGGGQSGGGGAKFQGGSGGGGGTQFKSGGGGTQFKSGGGDSRGQGFSPGKSGQQGGKQSGGQQGQTFKSDRPEGGKAFPSENLKQGGGRERGEHRAFYGGPGSQFDRAQRELDQRGRTEFRQDFDRGSRERFSNDIRGYWRDRRDLPFHGDWWGHVGRPGWPVYLSWRDSQWRDRPYYWWRWASEPSLLGWLAFRWDRPYYWDYRPGGHIYYQDDMVYLEGRPYKPVDQYYQYVYDLAHQVPPPDSEEAKKLEWMPLGVFAVSKENATDGHQLLQLAVSKDGIISGTYFNQDTKATHPIQGRVDRETQVAAWAFADGTSPKLVMETSINNLTQPEASMLVHFGPRNTETWQVVRLQSPEPEGSDLSQPPPG